MNPLPVPFSTMPLNGGQFVKFENGIEMTILEDPHGRADVVFPARGEEPKHKLRVRKYSEVFFLIRNGATSADMLPNHTTI